MQVMRILATVSALAVTSSAALASDIYTGDATHNPNYTTIEYSYKGDNYCPAGLQPVVVGGVICCGTPNAGAYAPPAASHRVSSPRGYAVEGEKGVIYR